MIRLELDNGSDVIDLNSVLSGASSSVETVVSTNLVTNPSFEAAGIGTVTRPYDSGTANRVLGQGGLGNVASNAAVVYQDGTYRNSGGTALCIDATGGSSNNTYCLPTGSLTGTLRQFGLERGRTYTASVIMYQDTAQTGTLHANARQLVIRSKPFGSSTSTLLANSPTYANDTTGRRYTVTFTVPDDCEELFPYFFHGASMGRTWWDAFIIVEGSSLPTIPSGGTYFTGGTANTATDVYRWTGAEQNSMSEWVQTSTVPVGVQAIVGATGFGMPAVNTQWSEGAGDGSTFAGSRVASREIDIPIYVNASTRHAMRATVSRLCRMLANPCKLRFVETHLPAQAWELTVVRTGGGDYTLGTDTNGYELMTVITVKAGDPFWRAANARPLTLLNGFNTVTIEGDAPTPPTWKFTGPGINPTIQSASGEILTWNDKLGNNETLTIDVGSRTVTDGSGNNRYASLGTLPKFWKFSPGTSSFTAAIDNSSSDFNAAFTTVRRNYVTNPVLGVNTTGWSAASGTSVTRQLGFAGSRLSDYGLGFVGTGSNSASTSLTGLTPGTVYVVRAVFTSRGIPGSSLSASIDSATSGTFSQQDTGLSSGGYPIFSGSVSFTFVAFSSTHTLTIKQTASASASTVAGTSSGPAITFDGLYVGDSGPTFSGASTSGGGKTYAWTGTAHASQSTETTSPQTSLTKIELSYNPRKWAVI